MATTTLEKINDTTVSIQEAQRIVIKVGSSLLVGQKTQKLKHVWLNSLIEDVSMLKKQGREVIIVSSGSIALGRKHLNIKKNVLALEESQAAASIGQIKLAQAYEKYLNNQGLKAGQILLTTDDSQNRRRYLNIRATMQVLIEKGIVPVVNENDTVATDEIRFGDNDQLAAQVALFCGADLLILLSDVDGLYDSDPQLNSNAVHIPTVSTITSSIEAMAGNVGSSFSKGGMKTKIEAAKVAVNGGCTMIIAKGLLKNPIKRILKKERVTYFLPKVDVATSRKIWILAMKVKGVIEIDLGASKALKAGNSLLPAGVIKTTGQFERGDPIDIQDLNGHHIAKGLIAYSHKEVEKIKGHQTKDIELILGYLGRSVLIHRDNMAFSIL